jgi:hypothetical protein
MTKFKKQLLYLFATVLALPFACLLALWCWIKWQYHLPSDQRAREHFAAHKADYLRFEELLRKEPSLASVHSDGNVRTRGGVSRLDLTYKELMRRTGTEYVLIREDGSIEFQKWGFGCAICSDSYKGIRFAPGLLKTSSEAGWDQTPVTSLDDTQLPQENGSVADGLYVVRIEPEWFVYRLEIQE